MGDSISCGRRRRGRRRNEIEQQIPFMFGSNKAKRRKCINNQCRQHYPLFCEFTNILPLCSPLRYLSYRVRKVKRRKNRERDKNAPSSLHSKVLVNSSLDITVLNLTTPVGPQVEQAPACPYACPSHLLQNHSTVHSIAEVQQALSSVMSP